MWNLSLVLAILICSLISIRTLNRLFNSLYETERESVLIAASAKEVFIPTCIEDFSPCSCKTTSSGIITVDCDRVSFSKIQSIFNSVNNTYLVRLSIVPSKFDEGVFLPSNVLGRHKALTLAFICYNSPSKQLLVSKNAFAFSETSLKGLHISSCDLKDLNWEFLKGFKAIHTITSYHAANWSAATLPVLPSLRYLRLHRTESFISWGDPVLENLQDLMLLDGALLDETAQEIFSSVVSYSSSSLEKLTLSHNNLTHFPKTLSELKNLKFFELNNNKLKKIPHGAIKLSGESTIDLSHNHISEIEPGAFQGNFTSVIIYLNHNQLTRLDYGTFKPLLTALVKGNGALLIPSNYIECDCHIKWLIQDNRHLLHGLEGGICTSLTRLKDLNPSDFARCL